jgi:hypothetical protein
MPTANKNQYFLVACQLTFIMISIVPDQVNAEAFKNLNFEDSPIPNNGSVSVSVSTSLLFPSWTLRFNDTIQTTASLNTVVLTATAAALNTGDGLEDSILEGTRSAYLQSLFNSASLAQNGDVPAGTQSIRFLTAAGLGPLDVSLLMNGQAIPLATLSQDNGIFLLGGNISAWAGMNSELRVIVTGIDVHGDAGSALIDAIEFSSQPIPEPSMLGLVPLGAFAMLRRSRR